MVQQCHLLFVHLSCHLHIICLPTSFTFLFLCPLCLPFFHDGSSPLILMLRTLEHILVFIHLNFLWSDLQFMSKISRRHLDKCLCTHFLPAFNILRETSYTNIVPADTMTGTTKESVYYDNIWLNPCITTLYTGKVMSTLVHYLCLELFLIRNFYIFLLDGDMAL